MDPSKRKAWKRGLAGGLIAVLSFVVLLLWATQAFNVKVRPGKVSPPLRKWEGQGALGAVEQVDMPRTMEAMGTIRAKHRTSVASKLLSRVEKVYVRAGDKVKAGDLLIELDRREWLAQKAAAQAGLEAARAELQLRNREYERIRQLLARRSVSQQEFDFAVMKRSAARARVKEAREHVLAIETTLSFTRIQAPVSGTVIERLVEPGDMAVPGKPLLTMYDPSDLRLEAMVRESLLPYIRIGMKLDLFIDSLGCPCEGIVEEMVPQASETARAFVVKVGLPRSSRLYPGMFGRLKIPCGTVSRLLIPERAVRRVGQVELVDVVTSDHTVVRRFIRTGKRFGNRVEVLAGLNPPIPGRPVPRLLLY